VNLWGITSSGMLRLVVLVRPDVLEEPSASVIKVTRIGELGKLAVTSNRRTLMMEALCSCETSVLTRATRCNISEDDGLHSHHRENLKSYIINLSLCSILPFPGFSLLCSLHTWAEKTANAMKMKPNRFFYGEVVFYHVQARMQYIQASLEEIPLY
jgi:hypothetical protein